MEKSETSFFTAGLVRALKSYCDVSLSKGRTHYTLFPKLVDSGIFFFFFQLNLVVCGRLGTLARESGAPG